MKMKNRKGSTLVITLMVFAVLMIFGTFTLNFMVNENKQSVNHKEKTQAYYLARSGAVAVEAAIMKMDQERFKLLISDSNPPEIKLSSEDESFKELIDTNDIELLLKIDEQKIEIISTGIVNKTKEIVIKVIRYSKNEDRYMKIPHAIYAKEDLDLEKGTIEGDIASGGKISNNIKKNKDFKGKKIENMIINYPDIESQEISIDSYRRYKEKANITSHLIENIYVYSNDDDINITLNSNSSIAGKIYIDMKDDEDVNITLRSNSFIEGDIYIDMKDDEDVKIILSSNTYIKGDIYIYGEPGDMCIILESNSHITGNIYFNGEEFKIKGKGHMNGLIYAPKAEVEIGDDESKYKGIVIKGAIVAKDIKMEEDAKATIIYKNLKTKITSDLSNQTSNNEYKFHNFFK